jgi:hypothetical protein
MIFDYEKRKDLPEPPAWVSTHRQQATAQQASEEPDEIMTMKATLIMIATVATVLLYMMLAHDAALWRALTGAM